LRKIILPFAITLKMSSIYITAYYFVYLLKHLPLHILMPKNEKKAKATLVFYCGVDKQNNSRIIKT